MEKKNPNIYQRALDIVNHRINPDIPQGGGGESAPEVENAIETHGLGWTGTEEKAGFDIQWDGNTEGREFITGGFVKVSDTVFSVDDLTGATITIQKGDQTETDGTTVISDPSGPPMYSIFIGDTDDEEKLRAIVLFRDFVFNEEIYHAGLYFQKLYIPELPSENFYVSRLYKEATTEEVVHQIDQKYIPGGSGSVAPVLEFIREENGESAGEVIVSTELTWSYITNAIRSNPSTVAHIIMYDGWYINLPVLMFSDQAGQAVFGLSGIMPLDEDWVPYGGLLIVSYHAEDDEMSFQCVINT